MKKRKAVHYLAAGVIGLIILTMLLLFTINGQISSRIPRLSDSITLTQPVREQISDAQSEALRNPSADHVGRLGMVYHCSALYEQAAQCYQLAAERNKSGWIWNYYLGYLSTEMGKSAIAIENFNKVAEKNPNIEIASYYIGQEYKNLRENELAERSFEKIKSNETSAAGKATRRDNFPLRTYAMFQLARIYYDTGRFDLAEKTLEEIIQSSRAFGPAYRLLGNTLLMKGDSILSSKFTVRANDLIVFKPPVDTLIDRLVMMSRSELFLLKKIDEAENGIYSDWALKLVNHAMQYLPDNKDLISKAIKIYLWNNSVNQAIGSIDRHIGYYRENVNEMEKMAMLFYQKSLFPQAQKYWTIVLEKKPEDLEIKKNVAICFWKTGDKQKSYEILHELIEKNNNNPDIQADIAYIMFHSGAKEKAMGYLTRLKQLTPSNPKVLEMSGEIAEAKGEFQNAITLYEHAFKGDPEDLKTIRYLGNLLFKQKMWGKFILHYRRALEFHPNDPELLERLGTFLLNCPDPSLRNIAEGKEYSERAFTHVRSLPVISVSAGRSLAYAYAMLGDKQKAIQTINEAIQICRSERIPPIYQAELLKMYKTFQNMGN